MNWYRLFASTQEIVLTLAEDYRSAASAPPTGPGSSARPALHETETKLDRIVAKTAATALTSNVADPAQFLTADTIYNPEREARLALVHRTETPASIEQVLGAESRL